MFIILALLIIAAVYSIFAYWVLIFIIGTTLGGLIWLHFLCTEDDIKDFVLFGMEEKKFKVQSSKLTVIIRNSILLLMLLFCNFYILFVLHLISAWLGYSLIPKLLKIKTEHNLNVKNI